ncbi:hypothetical protein [Gardnerella vaginalis]|nr:hypothetical protein [Gardnerella vaginalis]
MTIIRNVFAVQDVRDAQGVQDVLGVWGIQDVRVHVAHVILMTWIV